MNQNKTKEILGLDEYVAATQPPRVASEDSDSSPFDLPAGVIAETHGRRWPGAFSSDAPSPYEQSPLSGSDIERDAAEQPGDLHNPRLPHYPIIHERPEHMVVCYLKAEGRSNTEVAKATGFSPVTISNIVRQPWARKRIVQIIRESGQDAVHQLLVGEAYDCIQRLVEERDNPNARPSERITAADKLLDRIFGKPNQPINHTISGKIEQLPDEELEQIIRRNSSGGTTTATS